MPKPLIDPRRLPTLALITGLHLLALYALALGLVRPMPPVLPAAITASLIAPQPMPIVAPEPQTEPAPRPTPVRQPKQASLPPVPNAPPSPNAITVPPSEPTPPAPQPESPKQVAASAPPEPPPPIIQPRSDAAHLNNPAPTYPPLARKLGEEGRVMLSVYVLADGKVGDIRLKKSSGYERLDQAALDVVKRWRYLPAKQGDTAIALWYAQPVDFSLNS